MRLCTPASLGLVAAAALLAPPAHADSRSPLPTCATPDDRAFPVTTRIHGGPGAYEAGGGPGVWYLELTNTTARTCANIHPVIVLVDERRALRPSQARLEFYDGARPRPVRFEPTDRDELVGAFADEARTAAGTGDAQAGTGAREEPGFPGFTIAPHRTLTVKVRLAVAPDAVPNEVTANAAVVQRHDADGDWVGQSNDYRFRITPRPDPQPGRRHGSAAPATPTDPAPSASVPVLTPSLPFADELARTGLGPAHAVLATTVALLAVGGALLLARGRR
ncbi:hypothetical protein ACIBAI_02545 [Streptomyces sp. NPDC051041]|uniref:hypothetical protein n=1 Tax=Streptomyces sp. NPDC051041 TaxID=3365640 RepID=UPI00378AF072